MKKIITFALVATMAVCSQAASFNWGTGTVKVQVGTTTLAGGAATGYLVYLGSSASASYSVLEQACLNYVEASKASTSTGLTSAKGKITSSFSQALGTVIGGGTDVFANGSTFGMFITYNDGVDTWVTLASNKYTISGAADDSSALADAVFTFNWTQNAAGTALTSGGGWTTPVPEPATAALALAGLAMLIRRRK